MLLCALKLVQSLGRSGTFNSCCCSGSERGAPSRRLPLFSVAARPEDGAGAGALVLSLLLDVPPLDGGSSPQDATSL